MSTPIKHIYGRDLKVGDQIQTWTKDFVQVLEIKDYRKQTLGNKEHELATAYCTNNYNITIFLNLNDVRKLDK